MGSTIKSLIVLIIVILLLIAITPYLKSSYRNGCLLLSAEIVGGEFTNNLTRISGLVGSGSETISGEFGGLSGNCGSCLSCNIDCSIPSFNCSIPSITFDPCDDNICFSGFG